MLHLETLVHDFDMLRYLNPGAKAIEVHAFADALARPDWKDRGLLDTSIVTIRFDNGALATAEASFQAVYGYDVRAEVFGSNGMVIVGDMRNNAMTLYGESGGSCGTWRRNIDLFHDAYVAELADFVTCTREGSAPRVTGRDARAALAIALSAVRSIQTGARIRLADIDNE
jgi:myo-inositol 2-dehydrogenase / D-chiro-inositol 1-dehydrogenase